MKDMITGEETVNESVFSNDTSGRIVLSEQKKV